jgi:3,4-dihydroxy-2-butanone 4-phosphate synthase
LEGYDGIWWRIVRYCGYTDRHVLIFMFLHVSFLFCTTSITTFLIGSASITPTTHPLCTHHWFTATYLGTTTGISAHDRALTARKLADPTAQPSDFSRPGHILPLRAVVGGTLQRFGHTEAAVDLCKLAGLSPVGVIGELVKEDCELGEMARRDDCFAFAKKWGLKMISIEDMRRYRLEKGFGEAW